jgi:rhodanese-related sulfurtransferase
MKNHYIATLMVGLSLGAAPVAQADATGNRYGYPVLYQAEVSAAKAWLDASTLKGKKKPVILDVRRIEEYVAGHPVGAVSVPFPHITGSPTKANDNNDTYIGYDISVDPQVGFLAADGKDGNLPIQDFVSYVESLYPDKNQPLYILCATGHRSVQAANALAKYGSYTKVRNIWEGYNGQPKYAYTGAIPTQPLIALDLNNDDVVDAKDRDGWAYYQELPTETRLVTRRLFKPYLALYTKK